jgi:hypothetical protein
MQIRGGRGLRTDGTTPPCVCVRCLLPSFASVVQVVAHTFELVSADDYTLNYMESRSHEGWPRSNIYRLLDRIRPHVAQVRARKAAMEYPGSHPDSSAGCGVQLRNIIVRLNHPTGRLSYQNICDAVRATGVTLDKQVRNLGVAHANALSWLVHTPRPVAGLGACACRRSRR